MARPRKNAIPDEGTIIVEEGQNAITTVIEGAESVAPTPDEGNTHIAEPTPRKGGVGGARGKPMAPPTKTPIREMELTDEQQMMIIRDNIKKLLTVKNGDELQFGVIPALVKTPQDDVGFVEVSIMLNVDVRLVQKAWDYYKDNATKPKVKEFLDIVQEFTGRGQQYRRVAYITLN